MRCPACRNYEHEGHEPDCIYQEHKEAIEAVERLRDERDEAERKLDGLIGELLGLCDDAVEYDKEMDLPDEIRAAIAKAEGE